MLFKPAYEDASTVVIQLQIRDDAPATLLRNLLDIFATPYWCTVDFWSIGESSRGKLLVYPSFGTAINKKKFMKNDEDVDELVESLRQPLNILQEDVFNAHAKTRGAVLGSGLGISKLVTMWIRIQKKIL